MTKWLQASSLQGTTVTLEALSYSHQTALLKAAQDGELWNLWLTSVPAENNILSYIKKALHEYKHDHALPFVVRHNDSQTIIGSTRICNANKDDRRLEIGYTWYAKSHQRSRVNTECKYLLLRHAFETLHVIAVEFRTHHLNNASRKAIARIGAKQDGVLRNHKLLSNGTYRHTVVFSITAEEWPAVKLDLEEKLARNY